jgi:hypothetical protein
MAASAGRRVFILAAATPIAPMKQADQPAANNCSGLVPLPALPRAESLMSNRPSVAKSFPLAEAADALRYLVEDRPFGRVVLTV